MTDTRTLTNDDLDAAVAIVADVLPDIPLYAWVLGDTLDDPRYRSWLAGFLIEPLLAAGQITGGFVDGELAGLVAIQVPGNILSNPRHDRVEEDARMAVSAPGLGERLREILTSNRTRPPEPDAVNLFLGAVRPDKQRSGVIWDIMVVIEDFCRRTNRRFYAWTASPDLRDGWAAKWHAELFATAERDGIAMYGLQTDKPPRRREEL